MSCDRCEAVDQRGRFCYGCGAKLPPRLELVVSRVPRPRAGAEGEPEPVRGR